MWLVYWKARTKIPPGTIICDITLFIFSQLRDAEFNLIEIGASRDASLRTWKSYFPHAQIVGIDINPDCKNLEEESIVIEIGSQEDPEFIDRVFSAYPPAIVVDDGSHLGHHVLFSFERIFPYLLPGGYYVIEDMNNQLYKRSCKKIPWHRPHFST
jgi:cephalosporin hydroxylase